MSGFFKSLGSRQPALLFLDDLHNAGASTLELLHFLMRRATGARLLVQRGMGLNEGLDQARDAAIGDGVETLVVLHGDLPELDVPDIQALVAAVPRDGGVAIAPDRRGTGTNGLALRPPNAIPFRFGTDSLAAHREAAKAAGMPLSIVRRPGLAFDLDTPDDLGEWLRSGVLA